ncbi:glycoside hydrolase family 15 protein [Chondrinema litorale]|uniref:glycoside hydrolase family 15 protein n=1 Tax=Chondrinema litorale TaxID=2994555 RepID=UPI0025437FE7|nr:glycoside hydrolase family 15 protein [Chondrinema litorale]UZR95747.1 glycoside hydrolase family 15 protein [Chondrinema litorale]
MNTHKYNLGIIGNCGYLALIDKLANVKWLCWPKFDSSFIFGGLLDDNKGGEFSVTPVDEQFETNQYYIENTNVLCTEFEVGGGDKFRVTDFAPRFFQYERYYKPLMLVRKIEPLSGTPLVKVACNPTGEYGTMKPETLMGSNHIMYLGLEQQIRLTSNIPLNYIMDNDFFVLNEPKYLVITYGIPLEAPLVDTAEDFLRKTVKYWRDWVTTTSIGRFYQDRIIRSALVLKIHQYEDTGAIAAAATTSLPEAPNSTRNWDYRYCWMRDTYYILTAFNNIGHFEEMKNYFNFIENVTKSEDDRFQPLYKIHGSKTIEERIVDLEGYLGNKPVRVGNAAYTHIQNDVYGQVLVSLLPLYNDKRFITTGKVFSQRLVEHCLQKIEDTMNEPDAGLWEFRNKAQLHCYTFLFHWAGSAAAYQIAGFFKDEKMAKRALALKKEASNRIEACYDKQNRVYTQAAGTKHLDASCLQLITMNYLDPSSEAAKVHLAHMEKELRSTDGLFFRYKHQDDFGEPESTFLICAYWYIEALACVGRVDEAIKIFERLNKYSNHLGLLSEDVDAKTGSQWGNFPQAYSHVGQVNAAYRIEKKLDMPNFY